MRRLKSSKPNFVVAASNDPQGGGFLGRLGVARTYRAGSRILGFLGLMYAAALANVIVAEKKVEKTAPKAVKNAEQG
jgi:hypothetical protein